MLPSPVAAATYDSATHVVVASYCEKLVKDPADASSPIDRDENASLPVPLGNWQDISTKLMKALFDNFRLVVLSGLDNNSRWRRVFGEMIGVSCGVDHAARGAEQHIFF